MVDPRTALQSALAVVALALAVQFALRLPSKTHLGSDITLFLLMLVVVAGASFLPASAGWIGWVRAVVYVLLALGIPLVYYHTRTKVDVVAASYYLAFIFLVVGAWEGIAALIRLLR